MARANPNFGTSAEVAAAISGSGDEGGAAAPTPWPSSGRRDGAAAALSSSAAATAFTVGGGLADPTAPKSGRPSALPPPPGGGLGHTASSRSVGGFGGSVSGSVSPDLTRPQSPLDGGAPPSPAGGGGAPRSASKRPPAAHTVALPRDTRGLPPKRGLPDALEWKRLAGELRGGSIGSRERLVRLREVYDAVDADGSGAVSIEELESLFAHAGMAVDGAELREMMAEIDADNSGQLEFVEFLDAITQIGRRARAALRARDAGARNGGGDGAPDAAPAAASSPPGRAAASPAAGGGGRALERMYIDSRKEEAPPPRCLEMEHLRRQAQVFVQYQPVVTYKPAINPPLASASTQRPPDAAAEDPTAPHKASPVGEQQQRAHEGPKAKAPRRSDLAEAFPTAAHYHAALLLHAFLEVIPQVGAPERSSHTVPLETLQRHYAWARIHSSAAEHHPLLPGAQWQSVLTRWLKLAHGPTIVMVRGVLSVAGVRRTPPSKRAHPLASWDVMQLLQAFDVGRLAEVPWVEERALYWLPLAQLWPNLRDAAAAAATPQPSPAGQTGALLSAKSTAAIAAPKGARTSPGATAPAPAPSASHDEPMAEPSPVGGPSA